MQTSMMDPHVGGETSLVIINSEGFKRVQQDQLKTIIKNVEEKNKALRKVWNILSKGGKEREELLKMFG